MIRLQKNKLFLYAFVFLVGIIMSFGQECNAVPFMKKGAVLTYTNYNKRGKKESTTIHETISITGDGNTVSAIIKATVSDEKDNKTFDTEYKANCDNGLFSLDMLRFFNFDKLSEHNKNNLSLKIDGDVLEFPVGMQPGDDLNDGNISIKVNSEAFTLVTMTFDVFNREIVGEETITTPAGTYKCKKVTFDFTSKFGIINVKGTGVEWYYNDAMVVKSESYNKKGKLIGYHELTGIQ
ncbi:hypothetical protein [Aquimarina spongiae]|uniref:DUF3108 domain-containing protein n=1 Tax=Aquimarina spongiae TaxID=570521 RepID=A0A1M6BD26_9FLAO|nr:hypothetical protein [Aquimarina spongiae]SHI46654.1 hypothetical protein SAMN04488508_101756 [Aquimarina spongiae]